MPALVVFPQARETWAAGSADSDAALKALDDVLANYKVDPKRVILTGLSMGGRGSWGLATEHPERFAAVVPICGPGEPDRRRRSSRACRSGRSAATPIAMRLFSTCGRWSKRSEPRAGRRKITEYRGVGHNSWDRVYNDPELIDWMLANRDPKPRRSWRWGRPSLEEQGGCEESVLRLCRVRRGSAPGEARPLTPDLVG